MFAIFVGKPGTPLTESEIFVFTELGEACEFVAWLTVQNIEHDAIQLTKPTNVGLACARITHLVNRRNGVSTH